MQMNWTDCSRWFFFLLLLTCFSRLAVPKSTLEDAQGRSARIGMELELRDQFLTNLTGLIDFVAMQESNPKVLQITEKELDDYIQTPLAFERLPADVRARLSANLQLQDRIQRNPLEWRVSPPVISVNGATSPIGERARGRLERGHSQPTLPLNANGRPLAPPLLYPEQNMVTRASGLIVSNTADWAELSKRWQSLPVAQRRDLVQIDILKPEVKTRILKQFIEDSRNPIAVTVKASASPEEKDLFGRLLFKKDPMGAIEIVHKEPVDSFKQFLSDVQLLARRAGVESAVLRPAETNLSDWGSFHYHMSVEGADITRQASDFNRLLAIERVHGGTRFGQNDQPILNDLTRNGQFLYEVNWENRGLLRVHDKNRVEIRSHLLPLDKDLERTFSWLQSGDSTLVKRWISELWTPETRVRVIKHARLDFFQSVDLVLAIPGDLTVQEKDILKSRFIENLGSWELFDRFADDLQLDSSEKKILIQKAFRGGKYEWLRVGRKHLVDDSTKALIRSGIVYGMSEGLGIQFDENLHGLIRMVDQGDTYDDRFFRVEVNGLFFSEKGKFICEIHPNLPCPAVDDLVEVFKQWDPSKKPPPIGLIDITKECIKKSIECRKAGSAVLEKLYMFPDLNPKLESSLVQVLKKKNWFPSSQEEYNQLIALKNRLSGKGAFVYPSLESKIKLAADRMLKELRNKVILKLREEGLCGAY